MSVYIKQEPDVHVAIAVAAIPIHLSPAPAMVQIKQEPGHIVTPVSASPIRQSLAPSSVLGHTATSITTIKSEPDLRQMATPSPVSYTHL